MAIKKPIDSDLVKKLYLDDKLTAPVIAEQLGSSKSVIYRLLKDLGIQPKDFGRTGTRGAANRRYPVEVEAQAIQAYKDGKSLAKIAEEYDICIPTVKRYLKRVGFPVRSKGGVEKRLTSEVTQQIIELYDSGVSQDKISKIVHIAQPKISRVLLRSGIDTKTRINMIGPNHPSWKGGSYLKHGYRMVNLDPNDPLFSMTDDGNYILQHRLVMARYLGRALQTHETVHHIDGNRLNNELSNLQLMFSQPKGASLCCSKCGSFDLKAMPLGTTVEVKEVI